jgi:glycosyltransferase involved in cell wall biosynthesis
LRKKYARSDESVDQPKIVFIVPSYNIEKNIPALIKSIKDQDYNNWSCIIIDDISSDGTWKLLQETLKDDEAFSIIKNSDKKYALKNIIEHARKFENDEAIIAVIDGDDSLCNSNAASILAGAYGRGNDVVWTAHRWDTNGMNISGPIPNEVNPYFWTWKSSHLRTFRSSLLRKVSDKNFQDRKGNWFKRGYDQALMLPLMYVASQHEYVPEVCYLYNIDSSSIPAEERNWCEREQISTINFVRARGFVN